MQWIHRTHQLLPWIWTSAHLQAETNYDAPIYLTKLIDDAILSEVNITPCTRSVNSGFASGWETSASSAFRRSIKHRTWSMLHMLLHYSAAHVSKYAAGLVMDIGHPLVRSMFLHLPFFLVPPGCLINRRVNRFHKTIIVKREKSIGDDVYFICIMIADHSHIHSIYHWRDRKVLYLLSWTKTTSLYRCCVPLMKTKDRVINQSD